MKITIDSSILENRNLRPVHVNLLLHLYKLSHYGIARVSMSEILEDLGGGGNRHRVITYLRDLQTEGYIEIDSNNGSVNTYTLNQDFYSKEV